MTSTQSEHNHKFILLYHTRMHEINMLVLKYTREACTFLSLLKKKKLKRGGDFFKKNYTFNFFIKKKPRSRESRVK